MIDQRERWRRRSTRLLLAAIARQNGGEANRLIATREVAGRLGLHPHSIYRATAIGLLPVAQTTEGGHRRFRVGDVEALIERAKEAAT